MKIHILQSFPGESKGKTKEVGDDTAQALIDNGTAILAEEGSAHPEPDAKDDKESAGRKDKTDKSATKTK